MEYDEIVNSDNRGYLIDLFMGSYLEVEFENLSENLKRLLNSNSISHRENLQIFLMNFQHSFVFELGRMINNSMQASVELKCVLLELFF